MPGVDAAPCAVAVIVSCEFSAALFVVNGQRLGWPCVQVGGR